jgi:hypothetical protein
MKLRSNLTMGPSTLLRTSLLAILVLTACAPAIEPTLAGTEAPVQPAPLGIESAALPTQTPAEIQPQIAATEISPTEAPAETPQAVATSRGPNLEATDPTSVSLASGDLQLVEFFRFT